MSSVYKIDDSHAWGKNYDFESRNFAYRECVRVVLVDADKQIAILNVSLRGWYTLPGGGIDYPETIEEARIRELREEAGSEGKIVHGLGQVLEIRYKPHKDVGSIQYNYGFLCELTKDLGEPEFTDGEREDGYQLEWHSPEIAIDLIGKEPDDDYHSAFTQKRDIHFIETAQKFLEWNT